MTRKNKLTKSKKMERAGYSPSSVEKSISKIEKGTYYNGRVQEVLDKTGSITFSLLDDIAEEVKSENFKSKYSTFEKVKMLKTFFEINKAILPTITQKETTRDENGNFRSSVWSMVQGA
jgi:hypothetical protein